mgnify:CR=1 FL=1|tara:strand:- start:3206 stop:3643 length:438 start_codon:yes stop_codon:yes gene_type:complete
MTPEQKAGLMQLMGQTYGEAHKNDQMIVGKSGNLSPTSQQLKTQFENVARIPTQHRHPVPQAPPQAPPTPVEVQSVTPEQAAQEIAAQRTIRTEQPININQLEFDLSEPSKVDKVISLIEEQNLILKQISLKLDNGKTTKSRKQK